EPSYNQNYNGNYYPHDLPSFPCCDNCGGSHKTFQCQPIDQNIDFSGYDQIQTPQYPEIHPPSQEISDEVFQANHYVQYKEYLENSSNEIAASNFNQKPPQDFDIRQLIREECSIEVCEEQKQNMENTILELVEICQTRSSNTTTHADDSLPEYDLFCFEIEPDQERLINVVKNDISDDSTNDPLLEEADLFLAFDNSIPSGIENFGYDSEGDIHFLDALLIDDSIPFPNNESSGSDFDNPSFPRPPPEPLDADFELDEGEEISVVINDIDELECLDPKYEFDDDDYFPFMFFIRIFL
nr:hypothetical protein [Tanacetum cinerariifolium]